MISTFIYLDLDATQWLLLIISAIMVGMTKTGVPGVMLIAVPILAIIFGGKLSTGVMLPLLIFADIFGVLYYSRHAQWQHLLRALPWAIAGLLIALWIGNIVKDNQFKQIIGITILISIALMLLKEKMLKNNIIHEKWWFAAILGISGGFATMIGNVAGPIFAIYLLSMNLPKNSFIGTTAWFFAIINLTKLPMQVFVWKNITLHSLSINLILFPFIFVGACFGIWVVKQIPETYYRWLVISITLFSAILILI